MNQIKPSVIPESTQSGRAALVQAANNPSILPPQMQGVMFVTGYRGLGKSFLASTADLPQNICFLDFENKGEGIDSDLKFGLYRALTQEAVGSQGQGLFDITWGCFKSMPKDRFTTVILDNVSPLEMAMGAEAATNARKYADEYGLNADKIKKNAWGHQNSVVNCIISDACAMIKLLSVRHLRAPVKLVVNIASSPEEAHEVIQRISFTASRSFGVKVEGGGYVCFDRSVQKAVQKRMPYVLAFPYCLASYNTHRLAQRLSLKSGGGGAGLSSFFHNLDPADQE